MIENSIGNNRRGISKLPNYNIYVTIETDAYILNFFRVQNGNNSNFKIL
jgi:hypothetical protein